MTPRRNKNGTAKQSKGKKTKEKNGVEDTSDESQPLILGSREEPLPSLKEQYIFLLELYVNFVTGDRLAKLNQMFFVPTTVSFQFLHFREEDDITVTPVDPLFQPQAGIADDIEYFYSGRSVLFAIDQDTATDKTLDFILQMSVRKKMPDGIKPDVFVGEGKVDLSHYFAALRKEMLQCWMMKCPPPKTYEREVPLTYMDQEIGTINIFVGMSAFGQTIVTEFEAPSEEKVTESFIFKGETGNEMPLTYKCRMIDSKTGDFFEDSNEDLQLGRCTVCMLQRLPCSPCGYPGADRKQPAESCLQSQQQLISSCTSKESKPLTCADGPKQQGLIQTSRGPSQPCGKAVVLKVSGLLDDGDKRIPSVTVASENEATCVGNSDPEHDVFILRIGKKGLVGAGEKSDIQLEMKTPKGLDRGPPVRRETREIQTEDTDGKKGKKDKKKKKKK